MKIIKSVTKRVKNKKYYGYRLHLSKKYVDDSKLLNKNLKIKSKLNKIIIERLK